jgi:hypothetical protein
VAGSGGFGGGAGEANGLGPLVHGGFGGGAGDAGSVGGFGGGDPPSVNDSAAGGGAGLGGALFNDAGSVSLTDCTFTANSARGGGNGDPGMGLGGAVFNLNGTLQLTDCTLAGNTVANGNGGALYNLAHEVSEGVDNANAASVTLVDTILYGSSGGNDLACEQRAGAGAATVTATSANLVGQYGTIGGGTIDGSGISTADPLLAPLAYNGGPTPTMALLPNSPAIDAGDPSDTRADQRGVAVQNGRRDIGAFERQGVNLPGGTIDVLSSTAGGALRLSGNASLDVPGVLTVDSRSAQAVTAGISASLQAAAINVVGGVHASVHASLSPTPHTGAAAVADPGAGLAAPTFSGTGALVRLSGNQSLTINPGTYRRITVSGNAKLTLTPGIYVITVGGFQVSRNASVTMSGSGGVLIYNARGAVAVTGNATLNLSAQTSGPYAGLVLFQAQADKQALNLSGSNGVAGLSGTVYASAARMILSSDTSLLQLSLVVSALTVRPRLP